MAKQNYNCKTTQSSDFFRSLSDNFRSHTLASQQFLHRIVAIFLLALVSAGAWAVRNATVTTEVTPEGSGNAYISTSNTMGTNTQATQTGSNGTTTTFTFYVKAVPASGYAFDHWEFVNPSGNVSINNSANAETPITVQTAGSNNNTRYNTIQAVFVPLPTGITAGNLELAKQETASVPYTLTPANAYANLTYTSSNPSIATVDANGVVTGVAQGTATITVQARNASNQNIQGVSATCTVTVSNLTCEYVGYVMYSGGNNGYYLNQTTRTQQFDPSTCIWKLDGNYMKNGSYYIYLGNSNVTSQIGCPICCTHF